MSLKCLVPMPSFGTPSVYVDRAKQIHATPDPECYCDLPFGHTGKHRGAYDTMGLHVECEFNNPEWDKAY